MKWFCSQDAAIWLLRHDVVVVEVTHCIKKGPENGLIISLSPGEFLGVP